MVCRSREREKERDRESEREKERGKGRERKRESGKKNKVCTFCFDYQGQFIKSQRLVKVKVIAKDSRFPDTQIYFSKSIHFWFLLCLTRA